MSKCIVAMATDSYYGACGINFEHVVTYPSWRPAVQNINRVKIMNLANIWEELEAFF